MNTILITCCNEGCDNQFRVPEFSRPNSTIKTKIDNKECLICKNKKLLEQSTLYSKRKKNKSDGNGFRATRKIRKDPKINIEKRLDDAWSKLIKLRAGYKCEVCRKSKSLNSHHIYSRGKKSVRWHAPNGVCLCVGHHIGTDFSAHKTPIEFTDWLRSYKGEKFLQDLRIKANSPGKFHKFEKELILKELNDEIKKYQ